MIRRHYKDKETKLHCRPPTFTFEEVGDVLQLGDVVLPVATVFDEQREDVVVLLAGVGLVQPRKIAEHGAPRGGFLLGVLHPRDLLVAGERKKQLYSHFEAAGKAH